MRRIDGAVTRRRRRGKPHLMIVVPDAKSLEGISTDPNNGGPYVMFAGTPYAHIMAPTSSGAMK